MEELLQRTRADEDVFGVFSKGIQSNINGWLRIMSGVWGIRQYS